MGSNREQIADELQSLREELEQQRSLSRQQQQRLLLVETERGEAAFWFVPPTKHQRSGIPRNPEKFREWDFLKLNILILLNKHSLSVPSFYCPEFFHYLMADSESNQVCNALLFIYIHK
jgi:hypothetical protein